VFDRESSMVRTMDHFFNRGSAARARELDLAGLVARADEGDVDAQLGLGLRYGNAMGEATDFAQAARWYRRAADQNCALAQYNLGVMFARGQGVTRDPTVSARWLRKAAEGGDAGGQHELGLLCHCASLDPLCAGREASRIEAYMWLHLAAQQGYKGSTAAWELVTLSMSRIDIAEGNRRAAAFIARHPTRSTAP
jgi:TPR repeat protein